ncbi:MAG: CheY-like chemotaxis protein, partial [Candidatus Latescibacterota bacterium]
MRNSATNQWGLIMSLRKYILHIEDNPSNRKAVQHILRMTDYDLTEAVNGQEGLDVLENAS